MLLAGLWRRLLSGQVPEHVGGALDSRSIGAPSAVHIPTSEPPRRFEPFHRLGLITWKLVD